MSEEPREAQQELFEEFSTAPPKPERFPSIAKTQKPILISTTLEQILMAGIVFVLVLCGVFYLGMLRGKSLTHPSFTPGARTLPMRPTTAPLGAPALPVQTKPSPPTVLASNKPYTIQVVTHRKQEFADQEVAKLKRMGYVSFIIPRGEYFQVCAGQYTTKDEARRDLASFSSKYKDCFLRPR